MQVKTSDKAHAGYLLFPKVHELLFYVSTMCVARRVNSVWNNKKNNKRRITNRSPPPHLKNYYFCSGQQNKIWACGFSWFTGPVGLWSEKFFVKTVQLKFNKNIPSFICFTEMDVSVFYSNIASKSMTKMWDAMRIMRKVHWD